MFKTRQKSIEIPTFTAEYEVAASERVIREERLLDLVPSVFAFDAAYGKKGTEGYQPAIELFDLSGVVCSEFWEPDSLLLVSATGKEIRVKKQDFTDGLTLVNDYNHLDYKEGETGVSRQLRTSSNGLMKVISFKPNRVHSDHKFVEDEELLWIRIQTRLIRMKQREEEIERANAREQKFFENRRKLQCRAVVPYQEIPLPVPYVDDEFLETIVGRGRQVIEARNRRQTQADRNEVRWAKSKIARTERRRERRQHRAWFKSNMQSSFENEPTPEVIGGGVPAFDFSAIVDLPNEADEALIDVTAVDIENFVDSFQEEQALVRMPAPISLVDLEHFNPWHKHQKSTLQEAPVLDKILSEILQQFDRLSDFEKTVFVLTHADFMDEFSGKTDPLFAVMKNLETNQRKLAQQEAAAESIRLEYGAQLSALCGEDTSVTLPPLPSEAFADLHQEITRDLTFVNTLTADLCREFEYQAYNHRSIMKIKGEMFAYSPAQLAKSGQNFFKEEVFKGLGFFLSVADAQVFRKTLTQSFSRLQVNCRNHTAKAFKALEAKTDARIAAQNEQLDILVVEELARKEAERSQIEADKIRRAAAKAASEDFADKVERKLTLGVHNSLQDYLDDKPMKGSAMSLSLWELVSSQKLKGVPSFYVDQSGALITRFTNQDQGEGVYIEINKESDTLAKPYMLSCDYFLKSLPEFGFEPLALKEILEIDVSFADKNICIKSLTRIGDEVFVILEHRNVRLNVEDVQGIWRPGLDMGSIHKRTEEGLYGPMTSSYSLMPLGELKEKLEKESVKIRWRDRKKWKALKSKILNS